jgi:antitoxin HicB
MQQVDAYPFIVRKLSDEDGGGYLVEYPDIHHCMADGKTPEDAIRNGREALEACLATMAEFGKRIPPPDSSVQGGQWRQRVPKSLHARPEHAGHRTDRRRHRPKRSRKPVGTGRAVHRWPGFSTLRHLYRTSLLLCSCAGAPSQVYDFDWSDEDAPGRLAH